MLFHFIVVILWLHTKHDNKLIAMQATLSYACGISDIPLKGETIGQNLRQIAAKFPERAALISEYQQYRTFISGRSGTSIWRQYRLGYLGGRNI